MTHAVLARRGALSGAILIASCLLLAACSSGSSINASSASGVAAPAARTQPSAGGYAAASGPNFGAAESRASLTSGLAPAGQSIIYTASMTVRSANVAAVARRIGSIVAAAGGYTADEQVASGTPHKAGETIDITLKIPVPAYESVLAQLSSPALGKQLAMHQRATEVTQEVANVNSLVSSDEAAISALQGLLKQASSVSGLLQVQQQISADQSDLNSLQAQQRALDHETTFGTVTMTLVSPPAPKAVVNKKATQHGFVSGLAAGWRALKRATAAVLTAFGATLPFLIVVIAAGGLGYLGWRRFLRRVAPAEAGAAAAGPTESS
jgi:hypothetical protein